MLEGTAALELTTESVRTNTKTYIFLISNEFRLLCLGNAIVSTAHTNADRRTVSDSHYP